MNRTRDAAGSLGHFLLRRDGAILMIFCLLTILVSVRLFSLTVVEAEALSEEASNMRTTTIDLTARRGTIYDRNGNVLATSVDAVTIYANPTKISDPKKTAEILHEVLGGTTQEYLQAITEDPELTFVYIAKKVDPEFQQALLDINQEFLNEEYEAILASGNDIPAEIETPLTGIEFLPDSRREYPKGSTGAQIIGAVDDEGHGISGIEQTYDEILRGIDGKRVVEEAKRITDNNDPLPMINSTVEDVEPIAGNDIIISIDIEMQQYLELNLEAVAAQRKTNNASSILLDAETGEIIATASIPLYNRDNLTAEAIENGATNAKAITQPYEPGSTLKSVIAGIALEHGLMTAEDTIYCPSYLEIYDYTIKDSVDRPDAELSLRQIIANSSNIGVSLIEQQIGDEVFYEYLRKFGFGEVTHVDYPGETPGTLAPVEDWSAIQAANISFGQGLEVSLLQMASMYGAIANDGLMVQPHFLISRPQYDVELSYNTKQVFGAQTTRDLEELLRSCVTEGYGTNAAVPGYDAAGKTGTAEMGNQSGGYASSQGSYICSFVGYLDNSTSDYVFMSSFENPTNYADSPATTFFSVVMSFAANRYMVQPQEEAPVVKPLNEEVVVDQGESTAVETTETVLPAKQEAVTSVETSIKLPTPRAGREWSIDTSG